MSLNDSSYMRMSPTFFAGASNIVTYAIAASNDGVPSLTFLRDGPQSDATRWSSHELLKEKSIF